MKRKGKDRCTGLGSQICAGWPRCKEWNADWIGFRIGAHEADQADSDEAEGEFRGWESFIRQHEEEDNDYSRLEWITSNKLPMPWDMYPERFVDPLTWCANEPY
jgi:hypothetical protein